MTVKIYYNGKLIQNGHLIEGRTYSRSADLIKGLGYDFEWVTVLGGGEIIIKGKPVVPSLDMDLRLPSGGNAVMLDVYVKNTPLYGLGAAWTEAERTWRINAVFLCALACHESSFGRSRIAQEKKNLYGFRAYDADPYNSAKSYARFEDSIEDVCALLAQHYLFPCGKHYNGPTPTGINVRYASDKGWAQKVVAHMAKIINK